MGDDISNATQLWRKFIPVPYKLVTVRTCVTSFTAFIIGVLQLTQFALASRVWFHNSAWDENVVKNCNLLPHYLHKTNYEYAHGAEFFEKLIVSHLLFRVPKSPPLINILSQVNQSIICHFISVTSLLILSSHLRRGGHVTLFPSCVPNKKFLCTSVFTLAS
jgi:hypothetical protein